MTTIDEKDIQKPRTKANPNFQEKREARIERFEELADKNKDQAESRFNTASKMASLIPMGQPILIGHHSEGRDRRFRNRIHGNMAKGVEHEKKAEYYSSKASAAASNDAIMSDDPEALTKLDEKIKRLEAERDLMKAINKAWRKAGKPKADDAEGWAKVAENPTVDVAPAVLLSARSSMAKCSWHGAPFPSYALQNLGTNLTRLKSRLSSLVATERREPVAFEINEVRVEEDAGKINVYFPSKPNDEIRKRLKSYPLSLKWSPRSGCWTRKMTVSTGTYFVESLKNLCRDFHNSGLS